MDLFASTILLAGLIVGWFAAAWEAYFVCTIALSCAFILSGNALLLWTFATANPPLVFGGILVYVSLGIAWSFFKWWRYCHKCVKELAEDVAHTHRLNPHKTLEETQEQAHFFYRPNFFKMRSTIAGWVAYWPLSLFWTLSITLCRDFWTKLTHFLRKKYETIASRIYQT